MRIRFFSWLLPRVLATRAVASACLCLLGTTASYAERANARIVAGATGLKAIIARADSSTCTDSGCLLRNRVIPVTVVSPAGTTFQVRITDARVPATVVRDAQDDDTGTRPILMRGYARVRHTGPQGETRRFPVAATIYRDTATPSVEITTPHIRRRAAQAGLVVFKAPLRNLTGRFTRNARAQFASSSAFGAKRCGFDATSQATSIQSLPDVEDVAIQTTYNVLYIGTDYDAQFASVMGCSSQSACHNKILSIINQSGAFFEAQLGYTLEVARQFGPTNHGTDTDASALLDNVQVYNTANRLQYVHTASNTTDNQFDLFQLFSGKTLDNSVIGIAYTETACRDSQAEYAHSLIQHVSTALDPVVSAHEFGHTLGAAHTTSGIMKANLGNPPPSTFASESLLVISNFLTSYYTQCRQGTAQAVLTPTPTPLPTSTSTPSPYAGKPTTLSLTVRSSRKQSVSVKYRVASVTAGCSVTIRAAATSAKARSGSIISQLNPSTGVTTRTASIKTGVTPTARGDANVYFAAEHSCSNGSILEISKVRSLNPNRISGVRGRTSKSRWIRLLKNGIR
jgi:hypothetical protein